MLEVTFEIARFAIMLGIALFVVWAGVSRRLLGNRAWRYSLLAFILLTFGAGVGVIEDYQIAYGLFHWEHIGPVVVLEKGVGYLGGFFMMFLAVLHWLPHADGLVAKTTQAEKTSKAKSSTIANMSHELRTPLNAILGFSEIINTQAFGPVANPKYVEYAGVIHGSAQHLLALINGLLDISRIEAGALVLETNEIEVAGLLEQSVSIVAKMAQDKDIALTIKGVCAVDIICADELRLRQILLNMLTNAIKFTGRGGEVTLSSAVSNDGGLDIVVRDGGIGMSPEEIEIALVPFGQISAERQDSTTGTGLGLPISKLLMEAHGGRLNILSWPGKGTEVRLGFPQDICFSSADMRPTAEVA